MSRAALAVHHLGACDLARNVSESGVQPTTLSTTSGRAAGLPGAPIRGGILLIFALVSLALPARAAECSPGDDACELARAVICLDADLEIARAESTRLTRELTACRSTQGACPPPPAAEPYPWGVVLSAGAGGVLVGVIVGLLVRG